MKKLFRIGAEKHGKGQVKFAWQPEGNLLATAGQNGLVHIFDRHGEAIAEIPMNAGVPILCLEWNSSGQQLAVLQEGNAIIPIWDIATRETTNLDTGLKDPSFFAWSKSGPQLAIGTAKGNLVIYNSRTRKKIPVLAKHPRRITCGAWSKANQLALGSEDRMLTLSNDKGDTIEQTELKYAPTEMFFATQKTDSKITADSPETTISVNMGGKSLLLFNLKDTENPVELAFQPRYGDIISHRWFGDGFMLLGFSAGYLVVICTDMQEIGEEKFSGEFHRGDMVDVAFSPVLMRAATAGRGGVKIVDMRDFKELRGEAINMEAADDGIGKVGWSPDGQILTVSSKQGVVYNFLAQMPTLHANFGTRVGFLTSLREITVIEGVGRPPRPYQISVGIEPGFLAVGPFHIAVGMNNRVLYYVASEEEQQLVEETEYNGQIEDCRLNQKYAAVLSSGKVSLHLIEPVPGQQGRSQRRLFPEREDGEFGAATAIALTENFLIYGTKAGTVEFFFLGEWAVLSGSELRHSESIKSIYPNYLGTRLLVLDVANQGYIYNPVTADMTPIPLFPSNCKHTMWDTIDKNVFFVYDGSQVHPYVYSSTTVKGPLISKLGPVEILADGSVIIKPEPYNPPSGYIPICATNGILACQDRSGPLGQHMAPIYEHVEASNTLESQRKSFMQNLALIRLQQAWKAALILDGRAFWMALSNKALEVMDVKLAIQVYRQLGDPGMVAALTALLYVEDKHLLAGHIALLFCDYNKAQDLFLSSSIPQAALTMRRDLLHWDQALKLAQTLAPVQVSEISVEYAQQLEFRGESEAALRMYEAALNSCASEVTMCSDAQQATCTAGIARCTLRLGDLRRGLRLAKDSGDRQLCRECAGILESSKQFAEAAAMYELGEQYEKAAIIYIKSTKNLAQAATVMPKVTLPKLHSEYAKECEKAQKFKEAAKAYENAHDLDAVVRLLLGPLEMHEKAFAIVRTTASSTGANMVAEFCKTQNDIRGAIEFLLLAGDQKSAFDLAKSEGHMEAYAQILGDDMGPEQALNVAKHYEEKHELGRAGHYYSLCGKYPRALKLFLQCGEREVDRAIEVVGKARDDMLTHQLIDFLMGDTDGVAKDPNYIYRLYLALGNYNQAAKTAEIIARQEQDLGNYKIAHGILFETIRNLEDQRVHVPTTVRRAFVLLHSYTVVKKMVRRGDHLGSARMLLRVVNSISKFPAHIVPILTSCVIECQRAGLKNSSFEYASMLMRPEYRQQLDPKFKKKIEAIVRRPKRDEEQEEMSPCPISNIPIPITQLECPTTKDALPFCIITGRHMVADDWCFCPQSRMPALFSKYLLYLEAEEAEGTTANELSPAEQAVKQAGGPSLFCGLDPIVGKPVFSDQLKKASGEEIAQYIAMYNMVEEKKSKKDT